jgi:hypothetical protein
MPQNEMGYYMSRIKIVAFLSFEGWVLLRQQKDIDRPISLNASLGCTALNAI